MIGEENRFAHAAALAVAELPAHSYNPLFLHGSPGIGKTHLLHAMGNYVRRYGSGLTVRYATIEEFTGEFVEAIRARRTGRFKESFRGSDVVLIDDVQFLAGRDKTREEFFHTFNSLLDSGRQLAMTADVPPEQVPGMEERLIRALPCRPRGRARGARRRDATRHPRQARAARRHRAAGRRRRPRSPTRVTTSVRALEGALIRVVAYASLRGEQLTPGLVRHVLRRLGADTGTESCGIGEILDAAASSSGLNGRPCVARDRHPAVATARQVAMYLARELTDHSLPEIGRGIGGRSHTTVLHAVNRVASAMQTDPAVRNAVDNLHLKLGRPS